LHHRPYEEGKIIFSVLTVVAACFLPLTALCCWNAAKDRDPKWIQKWNIGVLKHAPNDRFFCGGPGIILVICGLGTLAAWCAQEELIADHEFYGPMLVTNTRSQQPVQNSKFMYDYDCYTRSYKCGTDNKNTCYEEVCKSDYYEATRGLAEVQWGGQWGCPDHQTKQCLSEEVVEKCQFKICNVQTHTGATCGQSYRDEAETRTLQCIYDEIQKGENILNERSFF
jgi:hypothetical protein